MNIHRTQTLRFGESSLLRLFRVNFIVLSILFILLLRRYYTRTFLQSLDRQARHSGDTSSQEGHVSTIETNEFAIIIITYQSK